VARTAPASPPAALATPNPARIRRSTCRRKIQKRCAVAMTWGIATAATASLVPVSTAKAGVSRLPAPKPVRAATAPATAATMARTTSITTGGDLVTVLAGSSGPESAAVS
jgi:hypothetical protein